MKKRYTEEQIIKAIKEHEAGAKVDDICRRLNVSAGTFYNWRSKYAGLEVNEAKRLACLGRSSFRYVATPTDDSVLRDRLKELAAKQSAYGYLMLHSLLKTEGLVINKKRTYRLYTEEGLQVRTKKRKKLTRPRQPLELPTAVNQRWSMDFVADQLAGGRRFRVLNVVDDYSREMVGQLVSISISGRQVARFLSELIESRSKPKKIICDNGTEFTLYKAHS